MTYSDSDLVPVGDTNQAAACSCGSGLRYRETAASEDLQACGESYEAKRSRVKGVGLGGRWCSQSECEKYCRT